MSKRNEPKSASIRLSLTAVVAILATAALGLLVFLLYLILRHWDVGLRDTPPVVRSVGPTMVQLERLKYLVSTRVHVADVLVGESRWLEGSWIIQGDALLAVDMSKAEIRDKDEKLRTALIVLPQPAVLSARVNHERTQQWDIKSRTLDSAGKPASGRPGRPGERSNAPGAAAHRAQLRTRRTTRRWPGRESRVC